jgi:preprotein translocase subunit SecY
MFSTLANANNLINFVDLFSGGALSKISILALGIGPYITSSIIMQLLAVIVPSLEKLQKEEGEAGRRKLSQYTRLFTVVLAIFQGLIFMSYLVHLPNSIMPGVNHTMFFISAIVSLTAGSVLVMWMSELITEKGIGNGGSLIIFVGIISGIPLYMSRTFLMVQQESALMFGFILLMLIFFATMILATEKYKKLENAIVRKNPTAVMKFFYLILMM